MQRLLASSGACQDTAQRPRPRTRGRSYAEIIQKLSGQVDHLHEALSQLQLENRDLKLRQEVLEQWCCINRLALQVMHTCGGVLMHGEQQAMPLAAVAALEAAEQWIQQQLVAPGGPAPVEQAAELLPPRVGSGGSASCVLEGHALSLQEYALRVLLAHPQRYAHVSDYTNPDVALAQIGRSRDRVRDLLAAVEAHSLPAGSDSGGSQLVAQQVPGDSSSSGDPASVGLGVHAVPAPSTVHPWCDAALSRASGTASERSASAVGVSSTALQVPPSRTSSSTPGEAATPECCATPSSSPQQQPAAAGGDMPAAVSQEAAVQQLAFHMLHCLTVVACAHLIDPVNSYGTVHRVVQLAGPLTQAKMAEVVAALQLSQEQRSQIAARVRVVSQLLAPVNEAWDAVTMQMRHVLLDMQQHQQQHQAAPVQTQGRIPAAGAMTGAAAAARGSPTANGCAQQPARGVIAAPHGQQEVPPGKEGTLSSTTMGAAVDAAAVDLHSRLSDVVQRLNALHRTLGWLETTQGFAGLGVLTWQQLGRMMVETDPYPLLPRYMMMYIASQWEEERIRGGAASCNSDQGTGLGAGLAQGLRPSPCQNVCLVQRSRNADKDSRQQQQQQQDVAGMQGSSSQEQKGQASRRIHTSKAAYLPGACVGPTGSEQWMAAVCSSNSSQACAGAASNFLPATLRAQQAPPELQQHHPHCPTASYHRHQQQQGQHHHDQQQPPRGAVMDLESPSPSTTHPHTSRAGLAAGPVPTVMVPQRPKEVRRGPPLLDLLALCDVLLEGSADGRVWQDQGAEAALDALLDMLLE